MRKNGPYPYYEVKKIRNLKEMLNGACKEFNDRTAFVVKRKGDDKYNEIKEELLNIFDMHKQICNGLLNILNGGENE